MESVIFEDSPLAAYLEGEGRDEQEWAASQHSDHSSTPSSPSFAPRGRPTARRLQSKFRSKIPHPLRLNIPQNPTVAAIHNTYSSFHKAVNSRLGRAENARFLEQFRYIIVASQLLSEHFRHAQPSANSSDITNPPSSGPISVTGAVATACASFLSVWMIHWARIGSNPHKGKGRMALVLMILGSVAMVSYAYIRRQWLQYLRQRALEEIQTFVTKSHEINSSTSTAISLIQEVELISRGYRISNPLPPISRLEDRSQARRCMRLRRSLGSCLTTIIPSYQLACDVIKPFSEKNDLDKYFDIYDISDADVREAGTDFTSEESGDDLEALTTLRILAARFHLIRKIFLCCLLALDANGGQGDFVRWSTAIDEIEAISTATEEADDHLRSVLSETENFPVPSTPAKGPLSPGRERWRAQLRKLNSLSSGIRGLQAKLQVLREESDKNLNESEDVSEMGNDLMGQYESIGVDLKALMQEWEAGKAALANNIDRNEKRISAVSSGMLSPAMSWGGLTSVDESGSPARALKILNGEMDVSSSSASSDVEEVFEAVAMPRQRSSLTREERIVKMKEDRAKRETLREKSDANTHMLRELESVINLRPKGRNSLQQNGDSNRNSLMIPLPKRNSGDMETGA